MPRHRTVADRSVFQADPVQGSRFVATVAPAGDEAAAMAAVAEVEAAWPDASHHCWAFRLRDGRYRSSDAGEPGGSAGRPILAQIEGHDLADVVVVVTRWFGGTKLGVGGLVRAYGGTAGKALDRADVVEVEETAPLVLAYDYGDTGPVEAVIEAEGLETLETEWTDAVRRVVAVPVDGLDALRDRLRDATSGRVRFPEP